MAPNMLMIKDINLTSQNWKANVIVAEKAMIKFARNGTPYQRFVLQDAEGSRVQATVFGADIEVLKPTLTIYRTYAISNANVTAIDIVHRFVENDYQWQITGRTPIKGIQVDGLTQRTLDHHLVKLADVTTTTDPDPKLNIIFAIVNVGPRRKTKSTFVVDVRIIDEGMKPTTVTMWDQFSDVDALAMAELPGPFPIALGIRLKPSPYYAEGLSTRNSTMFIINPPLPEAAELQAWCVKNSTLIKELPDFKASRNALIKASPPAKDKLMKIANLPPTVTTDTYVAIQGMIQVTKSDQKYYFIACSNCNRGSDATDDDEQIHCNFCGHNGPPLLTLIIRCTITDATGSITGIIFGNEAEEVFNITAADIKESIMNDQLAEDMKHKLSAPKLYNINVKISHYASGSIDQVRFTVKSVFPVAPENEPYSLSLASNTSSRKAQKQLFLDDASSASKASDTEDMQDDSEHLLKLADAKKRN